MKTREYVLILVSVALLFGGFGWFCWHMTGLQAQRCATRGGDFLCMGNAGCHCFAKGVLR